MEVIDIEPTQSKGQFSLDMLFSLLPLLLFLSVLSFSNPSNRDIFEKSRLAVSLGDYILLSCNGAHCLPFLRPNTYNASKVDIKTISERTNLKNLYIDGDSLGAPNYFVPRAAFKKRVEIIWFGVG